MSEVTIKQLEDEVYALKQVNASLVHKQLPVAVYAALVPWLEALEHRNANNITSADTRLAAQVTAWFERVSGAVPPGVYDAVEVLNRAVKHDPEGMLKLVEHRVPAVPGMLNDPAIQCLRSTPGAAPEVGMLGILNGIFGVRPDGTGWIVACFDDTGSKLLGFKVAKQEP